MGLSATIGERGHSQAMISGCLGDPIQHGEEQLAEFGQCSVCATKRDGDQVVMAVPTNRRLAYPCKAG